MRIDIAHTDLFRTAQKTGSASIRKIERWVNYRAKIVVILRFMGNNIHCVENLENFQNKTLWYICLPLGFKGCKSDIRQNFLLTGYTFM